MFIIIGTIILKKVSEDESGIQYEYKKQISEMKDKTQKPIWFLFPGLGGQWTAMAKALMPIEIFAHKVEECHQILSEFGIDLKNLILSEDKSLMSSMTAKFCATTAIEIALFDVMKALDIIPDGIIGHSFGGMIAEKLLGENLGVAAIAIDAAQIKGVFAAAIVGATFGVTRFEESNQHSQSGDVVRGPVSLRLRECNNRGGIPGSV